MAGAGGGTGGLSWDPPTRNGRCTDAELATACGGQQCGVPLACSQQWCDASTAALLLDQFEALPYLGRSGMPRFASFGADAVCNPTGGVSKFAQAPTYLGEDLPLAYRNDAARLAADWDVLMFCAYRTNWTEGLAEVLEAYVTAHGKGLYAVMDYQGLDITVEDFTGLNQVVASSGIQFDAVSLDHADASADVGIECLPDLTEAILQ